LYFNLFGIPRASWICILMSFITFEIDSDVISLNIDSFSFPCSFLSETPNKNMLRAFVAYLLYGSTWSFIFSILLSLYVSFWIFFLWTISQFTNFLVSCVESSVETKYQLRTLSNQMAYSIRANDKEFTEWTIYKGIWTFVHSQLVTEGVRGICTLTTFSFWPVIYYNTESSQKPASSSSWLMQPIGS
jgi:hypothetical protein